MINVLGKKDLADRRRDARLTLFFKIVNHKVNGPSKCMIIPPREKPGKVMHTVILYLLDLT